MSVAPLHTPVQDLTNSPAAATPPAPVVETSPAIITTAGLERTSKIVPLIVVALTLILTLAAWYGGQQGQKAYLDTLIAERGARNAETRSMVENLRDRFNDAEKANAEFRGRTDESLKAIKEALATERTDRRDDRVFIRR